jgi:WD40 repeat protein
MKMNLKHYSLIFSFSGILLLYLISRVSLPQEIELSRLSDFEDKIVTVKGRVIEYTFTKYGNQIFTIENNRSSVKIFSEKVQTVDYGDIIQATGEVQKYNNEWEIIVNNIHHIKVIQKWQNISIPLWQIAREPNKYINTNINLTGNVEFISNSVFYLTDVEKKNSILVEYFLSDKIDIYPGKKVQVFGKFIFDQENFRYKIVLNDESHQIKYFNQVE